MNLFDKNPSEISGSIKDYNLYLSKSTGDGRKNISAVFQEYGIPATVGTGGDYTTIQLALADGKYLLKIISNITESVNWGNHIKDIVLITDEERIVNLSVANTGVYSLYAKNINFSLTGTNNVFGSDNYFYLDKCKITGNSDFNYFTNKDCVIDGTELTINTGTDGIQIKYLRNIDTLNITGDCSTGSGMQMDAGVINYLKSEGTFGTDYLTHHILIISQSTIRFYRREHAGDAGINLGSRCQILGSNTAFNVIVSNRSVVKNSNINKIDFSVHNSIIENCFITEINGGIFDKSFVNFKNNQVTDDITITYKNNINNCIFNSLIIDVNACNITECTCNVGTITINATKDKTTLIGNRTVTNIVDNGTNTQGATGTLGNQLI